MNFDSRPQLPSPPHRIAAGRLDATRAPPWLKISPLPLFLPIMKLFVIAASIAAASAVTQGQATAAITDLSQVANVGTDSTYADAEEVIAEEADESGDTEKLKKELRDAGMNEDEIENFLLESGFMVAECNDVEADDLIECISQLLARS